MKPITKKFSKILIMSALVCGLSGQAFGIGAGAWGGYNLPFGQNLDGCTGDCSKGGIALGADLWLLGFGPLDAGIGGSLLPQIDFSGTTSSYLPIIAQARFTIPVIGIFVGGGAGFALGQASSGDAPANGSALQVVGGWGVGVGPLSVDFFVRGTVITVGEVSTTNITPGAGITLKF